MAAAAPPIADNTRQHSAGAPNLEHGVGGMGGLPTAAVTGVSGFTLGAAALAEDSKNPIKLTLHDWTGQLITIRLMGEAWKNAGALGGCPVRGTRALGWHENWYAT